MFHIRNNYILLIAADCCLLYLLTNLEDLAERKTNIGDVNLLKLRHHVVAEEGIWGYS